MLTTKQKNYIEKYSLFGGIIAVIFEWLAVLLFFSYSPSSFSGEYPLSYFATLQKTKLIFAICLSIAATSFWIFIKLHLTKHFVVPVKLFGLSMISYLAVAVVPFDPNSQTSDITHRLLAFSFTIFFVWGIYEMTRKNKDTQLKFFSIPTVILSIIFTILIALFPKSEYILFFELGAGIACQLWTIAVTYYTYKRKS